MIPMDGIPHTYAKYIPSEHMRKTVTIEEDWHHIHDAAERKKRQNRLRQRAWRERRKVAVSTKTRAVNANIPWQGYGLLIAAYKDNPIREENEVMRSRALDEASQHIFASQTSNPTTHNSTKPHKPKLIPPLIPYSKNSPTPPEYISPQITIFPLSPDHILITLVQYNTIRGALLNASILSLLHHLPSTCPSTLGIPSSSPPNSSSNIPPDLMPTPLQLSYPSHPFWIRTIPFPQLRDNLILMDGNYDAEDLSFDLWRGVYEGFEDGMRRGFVVWGDPWCKEEWEVSEGFVGKWGFLLEGCEDVVKVAERWRERRGDGEGKILGEAVMNYTPEV